MKPQRYRIGILTFDEKDRLVYRPDALLSVDRQGRISEVRAVTSGRRSGLRGARALRGLLAIPGLIDAHCHASQYPAVANDGLELLPWLKQRIFPLESSFKGATARRTAERFFGDMIAHGTTTGCVNTAIWKESTDTCFKAARDAGLRVIMGKVMMDVHSYDKDYSRADRRTSRTETSLRESEELCRTWHGAANGRLLYAFTLRFALSCTPKIMYRAGRLADEYGAYIQTHLAENKGELEAIRRVFPESKSYTEIYAHLGVLGPRTLLAHGVWLTESEFKLIERFGANVVHCPGSNAFLGSGIADLGRLRAGRIATALGSDVAAGPSLCMFDVMRQAVYGQRLARAHGLHKKARGLYASEAFYMATLGGARALRLSGRIGSLAPGKEADFVVVDPAVYDTGFPDGKADPVKAVARLVYRGHRAAVTATFVAGRRIGGRL
ncbi:MAG: guanine deaminase [Elusimicrobiota bacterium]